MKKKLLVTASTFPRWEGDTEPRFILDLSEALTEYFDVTVLVPAAYGAKKREEINGVKVIRYHYFPIHRLETLCYPGSIMLRIKQKKVRGLLVPFLLLGQVISLLKYTKQFDVVHAHWIIPQGVLQSLFRKPYILTGHGSDVTGLRQPICVKLKKRALKKAQFVTVVSRYLKKEVMDIYPIKNLEVISMGCKVENFGRHYRIDNYFHQDDRKVILFVGRLAEIKGVTYLIEAMKQLDNAILVVVGTGDTESFLKSQAKEQGEKIRFLGSKTHEELKYIYASADVFAVPSITLSNGAQEGLGLVILEAMASGLPVVASRTGGITELIRHGENGLLAEEKDADSLAANIQEILQDEEKYKQIVQESMKTVAQYDYKEIAKRYARILEGVGEKK